MDGFQTRQPVLNAHLAVAAGTSTDVHPACLSLLLELPPLVRCQLLSASVSGCGHRCLLAQGEEATAEAGVHA